MGNFPIFSFLENQVLYAKTLFNIFDLSFHQELFLTQLYDNYKDAMYIRI